MSENGNYMDAVPGGACGSCDTTTWRVLLNRVEHPVLESWAQDFNITRAEAVVHHLEMVISVAKMALEDLDVPLVIDQHRDTWQEKGPGTPMPLEAIIDTIGGLEYDADWLHTWYSLAFDAGGQGLAEPATP